MKPTIITILLALFTLTTAAQPMRQREQSDVRINSAESQQRKTESQIKSEVSETVELMGILSRTAGFEEFSNDLAGQYTKDTEAWFAQYRDVRCCIFAHSIHNFILTAIDVLSRQTIWE